MCSKLPYDHENCRHESTCKGLSISMLDFFFFFLLLLLVQTIQLISPLRSPSRSSLQWKQLPHTFYHPSFRVVTCYLAAFPLQLPLLPLILNLLLLLLLPQLLLLLPQHRSSLPLPLRQSSSLLCRHVTRLPRLWRTRLLIHRPLRLNSTHM